MASVSRVIKDIFNNGFGILGGLRQKPNNSIIVSRNDQFAGEGPSALPFDEFYSKYHQWPQANRAINSIHRRLMGSGIRVTSEDETVTKLLEMWMEIVNFRPKMKEFGKDTLITGTGLVELQYTEDNQFANIEHVPTKTLFKIFRDRFAKILQITQLVDGERQDIDPSHMIVFPINNPEREALGKSILYSVIASQRVAPELDANGNAINPERYLPSILDRQARILAAQLENAENLAKARVFVKVNEPDREKQRELEKEIGNSHSKKWLFVTNKDIDVKEAQISAQNKLAEPVREMNNQVDLATSYPSQVMIEGGSMGFASTQTPVKDFNETIQDIQNDLAEVIQDRIFKPLLDQWGLDYKESKPKLVFEPFIEELSFEEFLKIDPKRISDKEYRDFIRKRIPNLDDEEFEEWKQANKEEMEQMASQKALGGGKPDPANARPDIEKDAPKPSGNEFHLPRFITNPREFDKIVQKSVDKILLNESATPIHLNATENTEEFDTDFPEITDVGVLDRIEELQKLLESLKAKTDEPKQAS